MKDTAAAFEFASWAASRWRRIAIACAVALAVAGLAGFILPRRYTATATVIIEPPAGTDSRTSTAVSPVYLESLKTYEQIASGDSLFAEALDRAGVRARYAGRNMEALKRSVLRIARPVNTRVLEISVTLDDPAIAQKLAQYIAERTVELNRAIDAHTAKDVSGQARGILQAAQERLARAQAASNEFAPDLQSLETEIATENQLRYRAGRELDEAGAQLAVSSETAGLRARVSELQKQDREYEQKARTAGSRLERLKLRRESLDAELREARLNWEYARTELDDIDSAAPFRGERLEVLDPGVVPQRASFPDTPLNLVVALLISFVASIAWLALRFAQEKVTARHAGEHVYSLRNR